MAAGLGAFTHLAHAHPAAPAMENSWTVVTMASDGSWGVATDISVNRAIARAIADCRMMSQVELGCGAYSTTVRAGWSVGFRCGRENILAAAKTLAEALLAAGNREIELRRTFVPAMPPCTRVLTVDPEGSIVMPRIGDAGAGPIIEAKAAAGDFPVWKTVTLGTYRDVNGLREDLDSRHCGLDGAVAAARRHAASVAGVSAPLSCSLGDIAAEIIGRPAFTLGNSRLDVDLVALSLVDMGFEGERVAIADVYARARQLGLELCPAEVGPQLRLQYLEQPLGEFLRIAMEPIATYEGELVDLTVANGGASLLLISGDARADSLVHPSVKFVFVRPTRIAQPVTP